MCRSQQPLRSPQLALLYSLPESAVYGDTELIIQEGNLECFLGPTHPLMPGVDRGIVELQWCKRVAVFRTEVFCSPCFCYCHCNDTFAVATSAPAVVCAADV